MTTFAVRQYRPGYFSGFENAAQHNVAGGDILDCPWFRNFKHGGFVRFSIDFYSGDEFIISAHYANGEHWVAGFALPMNAKEHTPDGGLLINNWRYKAHTS